MENRIAARYMRKIIQEGVQLPLAKKVDFCGVSKENGASQEEKIGFLRWNLCSLVASYYSYIKLLMIPYIYVKRS